MQNEIAQVSSRANVVIMRALRDSGQWGVGVAAILAICTAAELAIRMLGVPVYILPAPSQIAQRVVDDFALLAFHSWASLQEVLIGFCLAIAVAIPMAVGFIYSRLFERSLFPFLVSLQTVPKVALAPILVMWFGYGLLPKVLVVFLISFFPILINTVVGMRSVEKEMIYLVQSMGASRLQTVLTIRLPKALPSIFAGLKIGIAQAVIGAVVGEFIAGDRGLGYLQLTAQTKLDTSLVFSSVVALAVMGIALFNIISWIEKFATPWQRLITERPE